MGSAVIISTFNPPTHTRLVILRMPKKKGATINLHHLHTLYHKNVCFALIQLFQVPPALLVSYAFETHLSKQANKQQNQKKKILLAGAQVVALMRKRNWCGCWGANTAGEAAVNFYAGFFLVERQITTVYTRKKFRQGCRRGKNIDDFIISWYRNRSTY